MNVPQIEPATLDDLPELIELLVDLFSQDSDFKPNRDKQRRGLQLILEEPSRGRIFVIRCEGKIVGMINLLITISTAEGGFVLLLEDLIVDAANRRKGYGSALLKYAVDFAKKKSFLRITLLMSPRNEPLRQFYKHYGFVDSGMQPMRLYF